MAITVYSPEGTKTAGKLKVVVAPAVADVKAPKITEIEAGIEIECALDTFEPSTDVSKQTRRKLCDTEARETVGTRTRQLANFEFTGEKEKETKLLELMAEDKTVFIIARPYQNYDEAFAAQDKVWVHKCTVDALDPAPINAEEGNEFAWIAQLSVQARELNAVIAS